jgi:tetratricopeptide (TPR) repeat protein
MKQRYILMAAAGLAATAAPAPAAVTVLGNSYARTCYQAAVSALGGREAIPDCDLAFRQENLSEADRVATHVNRGILKLRAADLDGARADFDAAIRIDPEEPEAYLNKGMALLKLSGDEDQAIGLFDVAIAKRTRRPAIAYFGRAVANEMNGDLKEAYRDYRQASALEPKWRDPRKELARFTLRQQ